MFFPPGIEAFLFLQYNYEWFAGFFFGFLYTLCLAVTALAGKRVKTNLAFSLVKESEDFLW